MLTTLRDSAHRPGPEFHWKAPASASGKSVNLATKLPELAVLVNPRGGFIPNVTLGGGAEHSDTEGAVHELHLGTQAVRGEVLR